MKMTVSYEWLCDLVKDLDKKNPEEIGLALTAIGAETEDITLLEYGKTCLLAKIIEITPLNKVSKLSVQTSQGTYTVVSNSKKLALHDYVIFAPLNTKIFGDITVSAKEIEGVKTEGLLLALENLGIETKSSDVCILGQDSIQAQQLFEAFCSLDAIYTLEIPGNRPDWLSVRELARALSISFDLELIPTKHSTTTQGACDFPIKLQSDRCTRYSLTKISRIDSTKTPAMIQKRLHLLGMRPINYLVDLSNAIMLELGQPTHAFDAKKIEGAIIIRQAEDGEQLTLLDDTIVTLSKDDLLICDEKKILALAGIMGGKDSGVDENTSEIYLESAAFNGVWIRRSAKRLGLKTESSLRFEKNIGSQLVLQAQQQFAHSISQHINNLTISDCEDIYPNPTQAHVISLTTKDINNYLGTNIEDSFIEKIIEKLDCQVENSSDKWIIHSTRNDLKIKEDIIEEIARFYGYDNIPSTNYRPSAIQLNPEKSFDEKIRPILRGMGLSEAVTVAFRSKEQQAFYHLSEQNAVTILNPLNNDWTELRTHLFDGLLEVLKININKAFEKKIMFSEIASVFTKIDDEKFHEEKHLAFIVSQEQENYVKALNYLNNILAYAKTTTIQTKKADHLPFLHPLNSFELYIDQTYLGFFGEIHPAIVEKLDLSDKKEFAAPVIGELNFDLLKAYGTKSISITAIPELPPILRDITLCVSSDTLGYNIASELKNKNALLKEVEFISAFQNEKLKESKKKNISLRLRFESNKPINTQEIDDFIKELLK